MMDIASAIQEQLIQAMVILVSLGALWFVRYATKRLEQWTNVKISGEQQAQIDAIALQAVHYAEEAALKAFKLKKEKPESERKLDRAINYAVKRAESQGLPAMDRASLRKLIESKLQESRR
jgi:hypothetical protein